MLVDSFLGRLVMRISSSSSRRPVKSKKRKFFSTTVDRKVSLSPSSSPHSNYL